VKQLIALFLTLLLASPLHSEEKKHFILYASFLANTQVRLADGPLWVMFKGDTFPVVMYKEQQTKIVLQLAGTSFVTDTAGVKVFEEKDLTPDQFATYRTNVQHYLDGQAEKWKAAQKTK
jgi:hypothetical protein